MKVVVAPKNTHISLLKTLRKNDPFLDIKLISKEELRRYLYPSISEMAIIFLMCEYGYSYEESKNYLLYLPYVLSDSDDHRIKQLYKLKQDLKYKELLVDINSEPLPFDEVTIIGYPKEDFELLNILKKLNMTLNFYLVITKSITFHFMKRLKMKYMTL